MFYQKKEQKINKNKIFKFISSKKEFTKQDVSDSLEISFPTVGKYISSFLEMGIIENLGYLMGKNNRKSLTYKFNPNGLYSIGINVEVNRLRIILINLKGHKIKQKEISKNFYNDSNFLGFIIDQLKIFLLDCPQKERIKGIGVSLPGIVDNQNKEFKIGTNFHLFSKDMTLLEEVFNLPVYLINEANAGAFCEYIFNNYLYENLAYISIDTGVGTGIILNSKLYYGKSFKAGEIGHVTVVDNGKLCSCGDRGCLEKYCSNTSLIEDFQKAFNLENLTLNKIFTEKLYLQTTGNKILKNYLNYLARAIKTLQLIFDLDKIIIGGEITHYKDLFNMEETLKNKVFNNIFYRDKNILGFSNNGDSSNLYGAAFLPFKEFLY
ncbi:ROK family protein [uncultured Cetobacterium sp.]|uniref:ROK family protein n=1 Tax=uncultured Cetobacterium sp. TaxID=527638 RepID=UPI00262CC3F3|nr:ROK family protein [uncultured Cetobacterium sp.]